MNYLFIKQKVSKLDQLYSVKPYWSIGRTPDFQSEGPGSIPGYGAFLFYFKKFWYILYIIKTTDNIAQKRCKIYMKNNYFILSLFLKIVQNETD
jgi:hypothetical protein